MVASPHMFPLGQIVMTTAVRDFLASVGDPDWEAGRLIARHHSGDWGNLDEIDKGYNDKAVSDGNAILSIYTVGTREVWVKTEGDRSVTTLYFPEED